MILLLFFTLFLAAAAEADFLRIEGGVGVFGAEPGGSLEGKNGTDISLDELGIGKESDVYAWVYLKHPVPIIPNVRIEYLSLKHSPQAGGNYTVNELDGILYYNLLDNLLWITADLGIDLKYVSTAEENMDDETALALLYGRLRLQPVKWLGIEAMLKATNYQDNSGYDARLKIDYTMTFIPVIQPGLELGYRIHKIQYKIGDVINKSEYTGVYGGLMLRF
jgi:outer membrane protein